MQAALSFSLGKDSETRDHNVSISGYRPWLFIISIGILLTIALPVAAFFVLVPMPILVAGALYLISFIATILVTSGAESGPILWITRLLLPLLPAGLVWWGLVAMGF